MQEYQQLKVLEDSTKKADIDLSVVCPVATNIRQPEKINRLSVEFNEKREETRLFNFGAIHPDCENYKQIIDEIVAMDLKAIKIHPDYQNTFFDDEKYIRLMDYAAEKDFGDNCSRRRRCGTSGDGSLHT